ncbi:hypothetical protein D3C76_1697070 [compost metagenome]
MVDWRSLSAPGRYYPALRARVDNKNAYIACLGRKKQSSPEKTRICAVRGSLLEISYEVGHVWLAVGPGNRWLCKCLGHQPDAADDECDFRQEAP